MVVSNNSVLACGAARRLFILTRRVLYGYSIGGRFLPIFTYISTYKFKLGSEACYTSSHSLGHPACCLGCDFAIYRITTAHSSLTI